MAEMTPLDPARRRASLSMIGKGPGRARGYACRDKVIIVV
jgi:hypothetical protein